MTFGQRSRTARVPSVVSNTRFQEQEEAPLQPRPAFQSGFPETQGLTDGEQMLTSWNDARATPLLRIQH